MVRILDIPDGGCEAFIYPQPEGLQTLPININFVAEGLKKIW